MTVFFYLLATMLIIGSMGVIASRNPIYSVLWLISTFCNAAGLFILLGAEFLAMTLIIVYVGAIAVLFLFMVMMLDIKIAELKSNLAANWPVVILFLIFFGGNIFVVIFTGLEVQNFNVKPITLEEVNNTLAIGSVLYTDFILPFQISGFILLAAMIGSIILTLRQLPGVKRQNISEQVSRNKENSLTLKKVTTKTGLKNIKYD